MCKRPFFACWYTGGITQPVFAKGAPAHGEGGGGGKGKEEGGERLFVFSVRRGHRREIEKETGVRSRTFPSIAKKAKLAFFCPSDLKLNLVPRQERRLKEEESRLLLLSWRGGKGVVGSGLSACIM